MAILFAYLLYVYVDNLFAKDVLKTLIGTFVGAGLAFLSNFWMQTKIRRRDEIAAGLQALFVIRSQFDDYLNVRFAFYKSMSVMGDLPECLYAKPMSLNFNESNVFDYKSLSFLLLLPAGVDAYTELQVIERKYFDLAARHEDLNNSAIERQKVTAELHQNNRINEQTPFETIVQLIGPELSARLRDHLRAVVVRVAADERSYVHAYSALKKVLADYFGDEVTLSEFEIPKKFAKENIPSIPIVFQPYLNKVIAESVKDNF